MFSERMNDGIDRDPQQYFKRANSKVPERGGAKKVRFGETPTERKEHLIAQRERWADLQNAYLERHCCKVSDEAAFCLIQRPYISKTLLTRRISPRGSP